VACPPPQYRAAYDPNAPVAQARHWKQQDPQRKLIDMATDDALPRVIRILYGKVRKTNNALHAMPQDAALPVRDVVRLMDALQRGTATADVIAGCQADCDAAQREHAARMRQAVHGGYAHGR
jgi:hypothetical protein